MPIMNVLEEFQIYKQTFSDSSALLNGKKSTFQLTNTIFDTIIRLNSFSQITRTQEKKTRALSYDWAMNGRTRMLNVVHVHSVVVYAYMCCAVLLYFVNYLKLTDISTNATTLIRFGNAWLGKAKRSPPTYKPSYWTVSRK